MKRDAMPLANTADDSAVLYARIIKRLGRNARERAEAPIDAAESRALWHALLARRYSPAQEAALLMGLRVHGEGPAVLAAFASASREAIPSAPVAPSGTTPVVLHCTGSARREPVLAPLLALQLAGRGVPVLLLTHDAQRGVNAAQLLRRLGLAPAATAAAVATKLERQKLAWWPIEAAAPPLARLLARRAELGFRNSAHSVIKLWSPLAGRSLVVANYTHTPYRDAFAGAVELLRATALLVRGTEGDPVAWQSAAHPPLAWCDGTRLDIGEPASARDDEPLPAADDLDATVELTRSVLRRERAAPSAVSAQVELLMRLARECT
jgi:anthranilate phosphoribosyltransferase